MIVYIAAPWACREVAQIVARQVRAADIEVNSRWLYFPGDSRDPAVLRREAFNDYADVRAAHALLLLNLEKSEGKAVEQGLALAYGMPIVAVGSPTNVFHHLPAYTWVTSVDTAIAALKRLDGM